MVDAIGQLIGVLSLSDCRKTFEVYSQEMLTASDIATHDLVTVTEDDSLFLALTRIIQGDFSFLPVVNKDNPKQLMGVISRRDIMSSYDNIVIRKVLTEKSAV